MYSLLSVLILIIILTFASCDQKYYDVAVGRCDGSFSMDIGYSTINSSWDLIIELQNRTKDECRWNCSRYFENCWMIEYLDQQVCRLYSKVSYSIRRASNLLDIWTCADAHCASLEGRCQGYWVAYYRYKIEDSNHFPLRTFYNVYIHECQRHCQRSSMCGSLNFKCSSDSEASCNYERGNCTILYGFAPSLEYESPLQPRYLTISWRCCPRAEGSYHEEGCRERITFRKKEVILGRWKIAGRDKISLSQYHIYTPVNALSKGTCLHVCSNEPFCQLPIFVKGSVPVCYIVLHPDVGNYNETTSITNYIGINYDIFLWDDSDCGKVNSNNTMERMTFCLRIPKGVIINFRKEECSDMIQLKNNATLSLYFEGDEKKPLKVTIGKNVLIVEFKERYKATLCKVFNCDLYYALMNTELIRPNIIPRQNWFAVEPMTRNPLKHPVEYMIILNTVRPDGRCFTQQTCLSFVRHFQEYHMKVTKFSDIGYNFLIGEDGNVYEGRGWLTVGAHTRGYNTRSIGVAFIGWFETVNPNIKSLIALRNLMAYGVAKGFLSKHILLKNNGDFRPNQVPGKKLRKIIDNWSYTNLTPVIICKNPHFDYANFIKYLSGIIVSILLVTLACLATSYGLHRRQACKKMMARINIQSDKVDCLISANVIHEHVRVCVKKDWLYFIEDRKSNVNTCRCRDQIGILWKYCIISAKNDFLEDLLVSCGCSKTFDVYTFSKQSYLEGSSVLIFHLTDLQASSPVSIIKQSVSERKCLCKQFVVTQYPDITHRHFLRQYSFFSKVLLNMEVSEVPQNLKNATRTKCRLTKTANNFVNFDDIL